MQKKIQESNYLLADQTLKEFLNVKEKIFGNKFLKMLFMLTSKGFITVF